MPKMTKVSKCLKLKACLWQKSTIFILGTLEIPQEYLNV